MCRRDLAVCLWAPRSTSSMTASLPLCAAITVSAMMRPGAPSLSWCSTFGPHLSARPSTQRQRPCASSLPQPCKLVRPHCPTSTIPAKICEGPKFNWLFALSTCWRRAFMRQQLTSSSAHSGLAPPTLAGTFQLLKPLLPWPLKTLPRPKIHSTLQAQNHTSFPSPKVPVPKVPWLPALVPHLSMPCGHNQGML